MKPPRFSYWLGFVLVIGVAVLASADTIELNNGAVLHGVIVSEADKQIVIEVELAEGTIVKREIVRRADIALLTRFTPEELAEREMQHAYQNTRRYELNRNQSYQLSYYGQVINGVLQPFLEKFPNSPHEKEITDKIASWKAEHARLEQGTVLYRGRWVTPEEQRNIERAEFETSQRAKGLELYNGTWFSKNAVQNLTDADLTHTSREWCFGPKFMGRGS